MKRPSPPPPTPAWEAAPLEASAVDAGGQWISDIDAARLQAYRLGALQAIRAGALLVLTVAAPWQSGSSRFLIAWLAAMLVLETAQRTWVLLVNRAGSDGTGVARFVANAAIVEMVQARTALVLAADRAGYAHQITLVALLASVLDVASTPGGFLSPAPQIAFAVAIAHQARWIWRCVFAARRLRFSIDGRTLRYV